MKKTRRNENETATTLAAILSDACGLESGKLTVI